jgi:hypothetical protein
MENTIANIRILDVVRLVHHHGNFIFVFLIITKISRVIACDKKIGDNWSLTSNAVWQMV